jgi:hypothetical protein
VAAAVAKEAEAAPKKAVVVAVAVAVAVVKKAAVVDAVDEQTVD